MNIHNLSSCSQLPLLKLGGISDEHPQFVIMLKITAYKRQQGAISMNMPKVKKT